MGGVASVLVPLVGSGFSQLPAKWFKAIGGVMSFGFLGLTCVLIIAARVWAVSARDGHSRWAAKAKGMIVSVLMVMIVLASAGAVAGLLVGKLTHITP